ncbi:flagellar motor protein MotA [Vibrio genomosp. F6]|uniref:MotA/TolQ/ExbB proton channel family protein n=1 Tax=Vibrio genomosp. F6 TaxID=723172 RepID=UPI0010BD3A42|nr:flagellar motor protein MotA [Vibrio genomosp. F6]
MINVSLTSTFSSLRVLGLSLALFCHNAMATDDLVHQAKIENTQQKSHNVQREKGFKQTEQTFQQQKNELLAKRKQLQAETDKLSTQFSANENRLAKLEETLRLDAGSLGELFGVVRQSAKDLKRELDSSITQADAARYSQTVTDIVDAQSLPSMTQLTGLWLSMVEQIRASGELGQTSITYINGDGERSEVAAARLGVFGLIGEQGYMNWNGKRQTATHYLKQPDNGPTLSTVSTLRNGGIQQIVVDPSRGVMLEQLANTPSFKDRIQAGGVVGKIILGLLGVGLIIALYRGVALLIAQQKIKRQLKNPTQAGDNPLGRILAVYDGEQNRSVEALELRLLEAVVDEQQGLEKGLSMLKLLAALAPMLGLLGTVTGMIETFQVITQFGNGDPKVMAGGISMALITTVLGLVAAMPLLLAHNVLSSQAENIRTILEKQGIGLVAEQAEKTNPQAPIAHSVGNAA